jgi:predicted RNase H-like nuclease (RuvC/YqgF family)
MTVENLLENLNNLETNKFEELMKKVNKIFFDFNKSSHKNYERATILIGKEMASIRESVRAFSKELLKTYEENKDVVDFFKTISQIKSKYQNIGPIEDILNTTTGKKASLNKKISEKEKENKILKQKIEEIKTSPAYLENLAVKKEYFRIKATS